MTIGARELEGRLTLWAKEYGGSKYENIGYPGRNLLQTLIEHQGFVPRTQGFKPIPIRTQADDVEAAVREMQRIDMLKPSLVVRCEYFRTGSPIEAKLQALRGLGCPMSKVGYYQYLAQAEAFLLGVLA